MVTPHCRSCVLAFWFRSRVLRFHPFCLRLPPCRFTLVPVASRVGAVTLAASLVMDSISPVPLDCCRITHALRVPASGFPASRTVGTPVLPEPLPRARHTYWILVCRCPAVANAWTPYPLPVSCISGWVSTRTVRERTRRPMPWFGYIMVGRAALRILPLNTLQHNDRAWILSALWCLLCWFAIALVYNAPGS